MVDGFKRPEAQVLPETSLVAAGNMLVPPPNQFTHELIRTVPFDYGEGTADSAKPFGGVFEVGTPVVLMVHAGGSDCWVVDGRGLYVRIAFDSLKPYQKMGGHP
ncbi:hypothetical protein [Salinarimonas soli]|uniref:Uncharacterized protein n=1 Tax=Salinarimonas soli TaxID=1638099 RepID=A0A5B2V6B0_9HYPH|nr:hypothetical protein [Salinarimonas soli]KAA2235063.1 hypothetical protein F0L46_22285 [Salinarimonas soli]